METKMIVVMGANIDDDELAFYVDLAMNECQRWLEVTCRELFIDSEDFIYSLRYGSHLRKIINKIIPACFNLSCNQCGKNTQTTRETLQKADVPFTVLEQYIDDEDWISQFLLICIYRLHIPRHKVFVREDLEQFNDLEKPYREFIENQLTSVVEQPSKYESYDSIRIRRLCTTVSALFDACNNGSVCVPQLDQTALEPLLQYHQFICQDSPNPSLLTILDLPNLDPVRVVSTLVEQVCINDAITHDTKLHTQNEDEVADTMMGYNYTIKKYLADLNSENSMEELSSYSAETFGSRSGSPFTSERSSAIDDRHIPTRQQLKLTSSVAHNPLQFVSAQSAATALSEQAKQQLIIAEQQKRIHEEFCKNTQSDEDEAEWQMTLNSWLSKRKTAISRWKGGTNSSAIVSDRKGEENEGEARTVQQQQQQHTGNCNISYHPGKGRGDCLTISSSLSLEERPENSSFEDNCCNNTISQQASDELNHSNPANSSLLSLSSSSNSASPYPQEQLSPSASSIQGNCLLIPAFDYRLSSNEKADSYQSVSYTRELICADAVTNIDLQDQSYLEHTAPRVDSLQQYAERGLNSGIDFLEPSNDYLHTITALSSQTATSAVTINDMYSRKEKFPAGYSNMKSTSTTNSSFLSKCEHPQNGKCFDSITVGERALFGTKLCCEQSTASNTTAVKSSQCQQNNSSCRNCKTRTKYIPNETDYNTKSKQAPSPFLPFTSTALSLLQAKRRIGATAIDVVHTRPSSKIPPTSCFANEIYEAAIPKSHLKTVDIHFEDKPSAAYHPINTGRNTTKMDLQNVGDIFDVKIELKHSDGNEEPKHFGFTVIGGKDKGVPLKIDAVIVGTPADKAGLQVGDLLLSIDGESVMEKQYQCVTKMLYEAERVGDIELKIQRLFNVVAGPHTSAEYLIPTTDQRSAFSFEQKRALFDKKCISKDMNEKEFQKSHHIPISKITAQSNDKHSRNDISVMRSNSALSSMSTVDGNQRSSYIREKYFANQQYPCERFLSGTSLVNNTTNSVEGRAESPDYRVTSLHEKPKPGKLSDFIPEVERKTGTEIDFEQHDDDAFAYSSRINSRSGSSISAVPRNVSINKDDDQLPRVLRNFDVAPVRSVFTSPIQHKINYWMKGEEKATMSLPRNTGSEYHHFGHSSLPKTSPPTATKLGIQQECSRKTGKSIGHQIDFSKDSREWLQITGQQRLPNSDNRDSCNQIDANLKRYSRNHKDTGIVCTSSCENGKVSRHLSELEVERRKVSIDKSLSTNEPLMTGNSSENDRLSALFEQSSRKVDEKMLSKIKEPVLSVSGKHRCSHCDMELGRGAAMIVDSLNLFYHLNCFRCYICKIALGNGTCGTDVRVRNSKLHCQKCYSTNESNPKFS